MLIAAAKQPQYILLGAVYPSHSTVCIDLRLNQRLRTNIYGHLYSLAVYLAE